MGRGARRPHRAVWPAVPGDHALRDVDRRARQQAGRRQPLQHLPRRQGGRDVDLGPLRLAPLLRLRQRGDRGHHAAHGALVVVGHPHLRAQRRREAAARVQPAPRHAVPARRAAVAVPDVDVAAARLLRPRGRQRQVARALRRALGAHPAHGAARDGRARAPVALVRPVVALPRARDAGAHGADARGRAAHGARAGGGGAARPAGGHARAAQRRGGGRDAQGGRAQGAQAARDPRAARGQPRRRRRGGPGRLPGRAGAVRVGPLPVHVEAPQGRAALVESSGVERRDRLAGRDGRNRRKRRRADVRAKTLIH
ncbi:MAG: hypothetical protein CL844_03515 [Crocinitomicaceae bacterium]|nr:hypothetical protein [Crocinitomicaceae bacterium]